MNDEATGLRVRGLCKTYGNGVRALAGVDLHVESGMVSGRLSRSQ